jgi:hypothetical protein
MRLTLRVNGELVRSGLQDLYAEHPKIGRRQIRTVLNRVARRMQEYPPERPGQRYVRTGEFFYSWNIRQAESDRYVIESNAQTPNGRRYSQYVVGDAYGLSQAWMHKGRWPLFRDVVEEEIDRLPDEVADQVILVARRKGL